MVASLRVLVVDDDHAAAAVISDLVRGIGPTTLVAYDAPTALVLAKDFDPDLMLIDLVMPEIDGLEMARLIRRRQEPPALVAVSGFGDFEHFRQAIDAGFSQLLVKPVTTKELRSLLQAVRAAKQQ